MCPPIGAGVLGLQCREDDEPTIELVNRLGSPETWRQITAERMMLHVLQGHCNSPIAGLASSQPDGRLTLRATVFSLDGKTSIEAEETGSASDRSCSEPPSPSPCYGRAPGADRASADQV